MCFSSDPTHDPHRGVGNSDLEFFRPSEELDEEQDSSSSSSSAEPPAGNQVMHVLSMSSSLGITSPCA